mmetsp:Transcript_67417/g.132187  ORF Transcript_67417/g.132187 Transcript_67417/m.132187 type:complete len:394 (+) Transcript_67417:63-1244(+)
MISLSLATFALFQVATSLTTSTRSSLLPIVDLRSDTVTTPNKEMRQVMSAAEVGDDVFGDDPTVKALERRIAGLFGKEEALFVPSGTMGNLISVMAHTWERGSEYIVGDRSHIYIYEQGGAAQFGGAHPRALATSSDGTLSLGDIHAAVRSEDQHFPRTTLLTLENTHNMCGGVAVPTHYMRQARGIASDCGLKVHLDGARIWNAAAALGQTLEEVGEHADSLSVCLSKAIGAPAGSLVVGDAKFIARARRLRKGLGGTMRQSGILAAAGLYALDAHLPNLESDHRRARTLAASLAALPGVSVERTDTNLLFFSVDPHASGGLHADDLVNAAAEDGVRFLKISGERMRMVLHHQVDDTGVERAVASLTRAIADPERTKAGIANIAQSLQRTAY